MAPQVRLRRPAPSILSLLPLLLIPALSAQSVHAAGQEQPKASTSKQDPEGAYFLGESLVTATRSESASLSTPYSAEAIAAGKISRRAYRTTPQILRETPGVLVQDTSQGQGSAFIRGFTGYRNFF
jgi:hemoglobin/transferrin/lactoferrin receptor protein